MNYTYTVLAIALLILAGCTTENIAQEQDALRIGAILPLTGPAGSLGAHFAESLTWSVQEQQQAGVSIELIIEDTQSSTKNAVNAYHKLLQQDVDVIYTTLSSTSMTLKPLAEQDKIVLFGNAAHPEITANTSFVFRHSNLAVTDAQDMRSHIGNKTVAAFYQNDEWGTAFVQELNPISAQPLDLTIGDYRTPIQKMMRDKPQAVAIIAIGPAVGILIQQLRELNYRGEIYSSVGLVLTPEAITTAGDTLEGVYYQDYPELEQFTRAYQNRFNREFAPAFGAVAYTDIELLASAFTQVGSQPEALATHIRNHTFTGTYDTVRIQPSGDIILRTEIKQR